MHATFCLWKNLFHDSYFFSPRNVNEDVYLDRTMVNHLLIF